MDIAPQPDKDSQPQKTVQPILLFDYGETLVQYLRHGELLGARRAGMTPVFIDRTGQQTIDGVYKFGSLFELGDMLEDLTKQH